ncbi:MAG TPA: histidine kinase [Segeticoccus sp.]|nr:histidine kinase [Segeticoccus sp.]
MTSTAPRLTGPTRADAVVPRRWWQRGWWQETWRLLVAALVGVVVWASTADTAAPGKDLFLVVDLLVGLGGCGLLLLRRRAPLPVTVVLTLLTAVSSFVVGPAVFALISLATRRRWPEVLAIFAPWVLAGYVYGLILPESNDGIPWWVLAAFGILTYGVCVAIGFYIGARRELIESLRERALTAEREQSLRVDRARVNERSRIAREMHDVLAHRISLVAMHAGALAHRRDLSPSETAEAAAVVRDNAHQALADLRDVLGVLRDPVPPEDPQRPQPTLDDLEELVRETVAAGTPVNVAHRVPTAVLLPQALSRNAYRIVQEALTNSRKHAPGQEVTLSVRAVPGRSVAVDVRNRLGPEDARGPVLPSSGMGLTGLVERAHVAGGRLSYGPNARGEFVVDAWLPWPS